MRLGLAGVLALLVLAPLGSSERPLPLRAPEAATAALLGFVGGSEGSRLVAVDPQTLAVTRRSALVGYDEGWVRSPDATLVAVATQRVGRQSSASTLRFASTATLRWARRGVTLGGFMSTALWPTQRTLFALVGDPLQLQTVDTVAKTVVASRPLQGSVLATARSADGLVLLLAPADAIGPVRVAVVGADGSLRSAVLDRIRGGSSWSSDPQPIGAWRRPALAVDPAGTAYVVDPDGLVAAVSLSDLSVGYHPLATPLLARLGAWLTPAAAAKVVNGPYRSARWLGDGLLAVFGSDYAAVKRSGGTVAFSLRPAGVGIVDTRDWSVQPLDPRADFAIVADGLLLATGGTVALDGAGGDRRTYAGLAAWGADRSLRWRLGDGTPRSVVAAYGSLAVVTGGDRDPALLVDLRTGGVVRSLGPATVPRLLLGDGS